MKKVIVFASIYAFAIFSIGNIYSGGGHGWGSSLIWNAFWPVSIGFAEIDKVLRCNFTSTCPPSLTYEIGTLLVFLVMSMAWYSIVGVFAWNLGRNLNNSKKTVN